MSQNYTIDMFAPGNQVQIDMQNIEHNLECLRSQFFGLTAPANPLAGMPWYGAGGKDVLRVRQADNTAWLAVLLGDAGHKTWVYRNEATPGWVVDATVSDVVLAIKGGAQAYNVSGGGQAGAWTISGMTNSHTHSIPNHSHTCGGGPNSGQVSAQADYWLPVSGSGHTHSIGGGAHTSGAASSTSVASTGTWRPAAAVGTLQYPDLS